jgi:hypothetical protein
MYISQCYKRNATLRVSPPQFYHSHKIFDNLSIFKVMAGSLILYNEYLKNITSSSSSSISVTSKVRTVAVLVLLKTGN